MIILMTMKIFVPVWHRPWTRVQHGRPHATRYMPKPAISFSGTNTLIYDHEICRSFMTLLDTLMFTDFNFHFQFFPWLPACMLSYLPYIKASTRLRCFGRTSTACSPLLTTVCVPSPLQQLCKHCRRLGAPFLSDVALVLNSVLLHLDTVCPPRPLLGFSNIFLCSLLAVQLGTVLC
jgi:hypothetical protein